MKKNLSIVIIILLTLTTCKEEELFIEVSGITLDTSAIELVEGESATLSATVSPGNAMNKKVLWTTSNASVVTVSNGVLTAVSAGNAVITVTSDDRAKTAICSVTVKSKVINVTGISLDEEKLNLLVGDEFALTATITPSNATNQNITWKSSNSTVVGVTEEGLVTALSAGTTSIKVTTEDGGFSTTCDIIVTISVSGITLSDNEVSLDEGESQVITATIIPTDATNKNIIWESSNPSVATVENGKITALEAGTTVVTATTEDGGSTESCVVTVIARVTSVTLDKSEITINAGSVETLTATIDPSNATNKNLVWTSSNPSVATVSNGKVTGISEGSVIITVKTEDGEKTATCSVNVVISVSAVTLNKTRLSMTIGDSETLTATISPANVTNKNVSWTSSNPSVVSVNNGVIKALKSGTAKITVKTEEGSKSATCDISVVVPVTGITLSKTSLTLEDGGSETITATVTPNNASNKTVHWTSSDNNVATVYNGRINAINPGSATITVTTEEGSFEATCSVEVKSNTTPSKWDGVSYSYDWYTRGSGGVYHIKTAAELAGLSRSFSQGVYRYGNFKGATINLSRDIDLGGFEWTPIGLIKDGYYYSFAGTFNGNNHTINGLRITKTNNGDMHHLGLFGTVLTDGFSVKNLNVKGEIIIDAPSNTFAGLFTGAIAGYVQASASIENCHTNVNIYSNATTGNNITVYTGGIAGKFSLPQASTINEPIKNCSSNGNISVSVNSSNDARAGGLVGELSKANISSSSSSVNITISGGKGILLGGIAGTASGSEISNTIYSGSMSVNSPYHAFVGGIIGMPFDSLYISNSLMVGNYYNMGGTAYLSAILGVSSTSNSVINSYYRSGLRTSTSYGTAVSEATLKSGSALSGFNTSIWAFPSGTYPYLKFE